MSAPTCKPHTSPICRRFLHVAALLIVAVGLSAPAAFAETVDIEPAKDNTLYEEEFGSLSNGIGDHTFVGTTAQDSIRRAVIAFDIAGNVPAGATITSAELTLHMSRTIVGPFDVELRRATADWGEGDSEGFGEEGFGGPSAPGDATWIHTFYDQMFWNTVGGDFSATVSATTSVDNVGFYTWGSTPQMVADVQDMLDNPAQNFGWFLLGDESTFPTAKRFDSLQNDTPANRPVLTIEYTPGAACPGDIAEDDNAVNVFDLLELLAGWGADGPGADLAEPNDVIDVFDLLELLSQWGPCAS